METIASKDCLGSSLSKGGLRGVRRTWARADLRARTNCQSGSLTNWGERTNWGLRINSDSRQCQFFGLIPFPRSRGIIARSMRRISSSVSIFFCAAAPRTDVPWWYQIMLSRTDPSAYSNIRALSFPELLE